MRSKFKLKTFQVIHEEAANLGTVREPADVIPILRAIYRDIADGDREHFLVLALDARGKVRGFKIIASGSLTSCLVHPRDAFVAAIELRGAQLILSHSHPSGDPTPSAEDLRLTQRFVDAGHLLGIPVIDHLVVASSGAPDCAWASAMPHSARATHRLT